MSRFVLSQAASAPPNARDKLIMHEWRRRARRWPREFQRAVRGLECPCCGSRNTRTEFYRLRSMRAPMFGVTGCDDCGAC